MLFTNTSLSLLNKQLCYVKRKIEAKFYPNIFLNCTQENHVNVDEYNCLNKKCKLSYCTYNYMYITIINYFLNASFTTFNPYLFYIPSGHSGIS